MRTAPPSVVPDVRTECCDAPVIVDPSRQGFREMVISLVCVRCKRDVGSPGPEDLGDVPWVVYL